MREKDEQAPTSGSAQTCGSCIGLRARAEAAEAAQAKLTEALRAAYAVNMRMLALYSPDMVGSKSGHSLMRSICEVNTTIDAILTSATSAPQAPQEDVK